MAKRTRTGICGSTAAAGETVGRIWPASQTVSPTAPCERVLNNPSEAEGHSVPSAILSTIPVWASSGILSLWIGSLIGLGNYLPPRVSEPSNTSLSTSGFVTQKACFNQRSQTTRCSHGIVARILHLFGNDPIDGPANDQRGGATISVRFQPTCYPRLLNQIRQWLPPCRRFWFDVSIGQGLDKNLGVITVLTKVFNHRIRIAGDRLMRRRSINGCTNVFNELLQYMLVGGFDDACGRAEIVQHRGFRNVGTRSNLGQRHPRISLGCDQRDGDFYELRFSRPLRQRLSLYFFIHDNDSTAW